MFEVNDWCKRNEEVHSVSQPILVEAERIEHLSRSLGMTNVSQLLLSCFAEDLLDLGRQVEVSKVLETVVIVSLLVVVSIVLGISHGIHVASVVAQPDIIASRGKLVGDSLVLLIFKPVTSR